MFSTENLSILKNLRYTVQPYFNNPLDNRTGLMELIPDNVHRLSDYSFKIEEQNIESYVNYTLSFSIDNGGYWITLGNFNNADDILKYLENVHQITESSHQFSRGSLHIDNQILRTRYKHISERQSKDSRLENYVLSVPDEVIMRHPKFPVMLVSNENKDSIHSMDIIHKTHIPTDLVKKFNNRRSLYPFTGKTYLKLIWYKDTSFYSTLMDFTTNSSITTNKKLLSRIDTLVELFTDPRFDYLLMMSTSDNFGSILDGARSRHEILFFSSIDLVFTSDINLIRTLSLFDSRYTLMQKSEA